jgi:hypothetical protein
VNFKDFDWFRFFLFLGLSALLAASVLLYGNTFGMFAP